MLNFNLKITKKDIENYLNEMIGYNMDQINDYNNLNDFYDNCNKSIQDYNNYNNCLRNYSFI